MSWETMRDLGLITFATGALAAFGLTRILHRQLDCAKVALMATIGDAMMLFGACLAVTAMAIGFLVSSASPS
jgi:uncharacterized membrane-anchored protein